MTNKYRPVRDIQAPPETAATISQMGPRSVRAIVALLASLVLIVSATGYFTVGRLGNDIASAGNLSLGGGKGMKAGKDGAVDILLVGSDSRTDAQGNPLSEQEIDMLRAGDEENDNTDTIMIIRVPNDGSSATAISIPRDTYIHDEKMGNMKINGVYGAYKNEKKTELFHGGLTNESKLEEQSKDAGRKALISAVADLSGITVDHYAEIGLLGFVLFTDAVGGVDVCLNEAVQDEYSGANFTAGRQTLSGPDALSFVRQRHGLPRGDLDRIVRQQAFMASLVNKVLSTGTLSNPSKLNDLSGAVKRSVVIDEDWDIMSFANQLQNLAGGNVHFETIPVTSIDGVGDYGESVVTVNKKDVSDFFKTLLGSDAPSSSAAPTSAAPSVDGVSLTVLNASGITGLANSVASSLRDSGYSITEASNAPDGMYSQSQVLAANPDDEKAKALAQLLGGVPVNASQSLSEGSLVAVIASDYNGPKSSKSSTETSSAFVPDVVGQPGVDASESVSVAPKIDAGGNGPRCVN